MITADLQKPYRSSPLDAHGSTKLLDAPASWFAYVVKPVSVLTDFTAAPTSGVVPLPQRCASRLLVPREALIWGRVVDLRDAVGLLGSAKHDPHRTELCCRSILF